MDQASNREMNVQTFSQQFNLSLTLTCAFFAQCKRLGRDVRTLVFEGKAEKAVSTLLSSTNLRQMHLPTFMKLLREYVIVERTDKVTSELLSLLAINASSDGIPLHLCIIPINASNRERSINGQTYTTLFIESVTGNGLSEPAFVVSESTLKHNETRYRNFLRFITQEQPVKLKNVPANLIERLGWDETDDELMCAHKFDFNDLAKLSTDQYAKLVSYLIGNTNTGGVIDMSGNSDSGNPLEFVELFILSKEKPNLVEYATKLLSKGRAANAPVQKTVLRFKIGSFVSYKDTTYQITAITDVMAEGNYILMDDDFNTVGVPVSEGNNIFIGVE